MCFQFCRKKMINEEIQSEFKYSYSRSSGAGGQHVNKVSSKAEVRFNISDSYYLSDNEKDRINEKLKARINLAGEIVLSSQEYRSQPKNKLDVTKRLFRLLNTAIIPDKKRRKTKPSKASKEKRLQLKKIQSLKKAERRNKPQF